MTKVKKILSLLIVSVLIVISVDISLFKFSAATVTTAYIEGTDVRVRTEASKKSTIIEKISNTSANVLSSVENTEGLWYKITYNNGTKQITGYIFYDKEYIRIVEYNPDESFEKKLNAFPASYHNALKSLHSEYPNWEFIPDPINTRFSDAVSAQSVNMRKQVSFSGQPVSWRSMGQGSYDWSKGDWVSTNGGWTGASREIIAYYMDPRNFLNNSNIYMFMQQSYNADYQTEAGLKKIVAGTFLANTYSDANDTAYGGSYIKVIMEAAKQSKVSPYVIASKIIQEQGSGGDTSLIAGTYPGYKGYYNFFNVGASGSSDKEVIINGLKRAYAEGWNTRSKSIIGGAKFLAQNYISKKQDTYYYQDFNVLNENELWHQYAQAVHDAYNKGASLAKTYKSDTSFSLSFKIPVYTDMPTSASPKPAQSTKKNNYYFSSISVSGLTPSFNMYTYDYNLYVTGNTSVYVKPVTGASYAGDKSYSLKKGKNLINLKVKSETGYITDYTVNVEASKACTLTVSTGTPPSTSTNSSSSSGSSSNNSSSSNSSSNGSTSSSVSVKRGDTNGDNKITITDLAKIRLHLLGISMLKGNNLTGADVNGDGGITITDLAKVRLHLLGISLLK